MEKQIITFSANEQRLIKTGGIECYASNIVSYIEAHFDLGANWSGYDSVRAVWSNDNNMTVISTVLDSNGVCVVPFEVLKTKGIVKVNLVGSISISDVLTDRLTTFPCEAVKVTAKAKIEGSETQPITPSQFEQFVAAVISEVEKVTGMTAQAETLPAGSQATARYENGILYLGIPQGIQGERGETGADGADGNGIASVVYNADYSLTLVFDNRERFTTPPIRGERGPAGQDGRDGTNGRDGADGVTPNLSIGTVETLEPTQDAYVTRRGTDDNPIFDFGIPKGDKGDPGEVTMSQLSSLLPTDTASGSIASFPDGTDLFPALSVKAQIEPIQSGSGTPSPSNVRPISGHTEVVTLVSGVNVWDEEWELGYYGTDGNPVASTTIIRGKNYIPVLPTTPYYLRTNGTTMYVCQYDAEKVFIQRNSFADEVFTPNASTRYIRINLTSAYGTTYNNDISINYPSTDHEYHAYAGHTYTTDLGRTVYGGSLGVVSGVVTVDRAMVDLGSLDWNYVSASGAERFYSVNIRETIKPPINNNAVANIVSSNYVAVTMNTIASGSADKVIACAYNGFVAIRDTSYTNATAFKEAMNGVQLVYELATPQTYQLDPQTIDLLLGQNNVWTDCGAVEVTYKADVGLYIDKKLSSNGTRSLSMGLTKSATAESETETEPSKTEAETKAEETKTEASKTETETEAVEAKTETDKSETR